MVSKVFERIVADQLTAYFENLLSSCLSAYQKGYNCQHVILRLTEYWRQALDGGNFVGTVAMDLSKAFDRMPHGLLIAKLHAYGLLINACQLIISYLKDRRQRVKVMGECSDWTTTNHGVPQGSVMGPLLFNIFLNPLCAKFFRGSINIYIRFMSFLHIDTTQVVDILPRIRQEPTYSK